MKPADKYKIDHDIQSNSDIPVYYGPEDLEDLEDTEDNVFLREHPYNLEAFEVIGRAKKLKKVQKALESKGYVIKQSAAKLHNLSVLEVLGIRCAIDTFEESLSYGNYAEVDQNFLKAAFGALELPLSTELKTVADRMNNGDQQNVNGYWSNLKLLKAALDSQG